MITVRTLATQDELISRTQETLQKILSTPGNLMLSGGSTPYSVYNRIAASPCEVHPKRRLFLSDERMAPLDSPRNNAGNLQPMLRSLNCEDRFIRVDTDLPVEEAARRFARDLEPLERIDLGLLGLGADGHTAGIFTPAQARRSSGDLTFYTDRPDGLPRVSVAPVLFRRMEKIVLLVTGESKRRIIATLLDEPETLPAGIALAGHPSVELWTDQPI